MSILTEQEILAMWEETYVQRGDTGIEFARAIESAVIAKIKAQGAAAWLHCERQDADVVTDAVKHVWGKVAIGSLALYDIPLYRLPEGD